jgi:iron(III) transport system substrate-binding protein
MNRVQRRSWVVVAAVAVLLLACAPAAAPRAAESPAPPAASAGQAGSTAAAEAAAWEQVVAAANREGKVVVYGPATAEIRHALTEEFERLYPGIKVDYTGGPGGALGPKIIPERQAGQYNWDLVVAGTSVHLDLMKSQVLDPIAPYLGGPDTRDFSPWLGGQLEFGDEAREINVVLSSYVKAPVAYHPGSVAPGEIRSYRDLLNPKWKGRIAMYDPRVPGTGASFANFFYTHPALGREFFRQILGQDLIFSRDDRQLLDWVTRGQYALVLAPSEKVTTDLASRGIQVAVLGPEDLAEGSYVAAGAGSISVVNRPPHPNATRVFVNWLLSRDGQLAFSKGAGYTSRRTDVPTDHLPGITAPKPGVQYQENYKQKYVEMEAETQDFLKSVLGS